MNNKILLGIVAAMMALVFSLASVSADAWTNNTFSNSLTAENLTTYLPISCLQETPYQTTTGDGACNLNGDVYYTGTWATSGLTNSGNGVDGNYGTLTSPYSTSAWIIVNYTTANGQTGASWIMKDNIGQSTYTLPSSCIGSRVSMYITIDNTGSKLLNAYCYNFTSNAYDVLLRSQIGAYQFYEEAIYWNYSQIRNIKVPQNTYLINARMNLSSFNRSEYKYPVTEAFLANTGYSPGFGCGASISNRGNVIDKNINTLATYSVSCTWSGSGSFAWTYDNFTVTWPTDATSFGINTQLSSSSGLLYYVSLHIWNYNTSAFDDIHTFNAGDPNNVYTTYEIARNTNYINSTTNASIVQIYVSGNMPNPGYYGNIYVNIREFLMKSPTAITNPTVKVGGTNIFSYTGTFSQANNRTTNFAQTVNAYINNCTLVGGYCFVPITFSSGTTALFKYSDLQFNNYGWIENAQTYNNLTYETAPEIFTLNFTYDPYYYTSRNITFMYNGIEYPTTVSQSNNYFIATADFDIPDIPGDSQINLFYWKLQLTNSSGTTTFNSTAHNQTVYRMDFYHCNNTSPNKFITILYKDETTNEYINASVITSSWSFNILGSSLIRSLVYSSGGANATTSDSFCFDPAQLTIQVPTAEYQYGNSAAGYSTKLYPFRSLTLTNSTTTVVLYLINLVDSGTSPVTFQAVNSQTSTVIEDVRVSAYRTINGIETLVDDGYTDASGVITYYMSPITPYKIVATAPGCAVLTSTITPSSNQYNLIINCGTTGNQFVTQLDGITYQRTPADGVNRPGAINWSFYVKSQNATMDRVRFEIVDATDGSILTFVDSLTNTPTCNPYNCTLSTVYTTYTGDNIKGKYYVAVNGTSDASLVLIEGDAYWRFIVINQNNSVNAIGRLMINVQEFFNTWGTSTPNCLKYNTQLTCEADNACKWVTYDEWVAKDNPLWGETESKCIAREDLNKIEFSRFVTIFFLMAVFLFILGRTTGYELNHPGAFVIGMSVVIWALSMYGLFSFAGLTQSDFFNQYIFAMTSTCIALGYAISVIRRYSG